MHIVLSVALLGTCNSLPLKMKEVPALYCLLAVVAMLLSAEGHHCPLLHAAADAQKTGCYTVMLKEATTAEEFQNVLRRVRQVADDARVYSTVTKVVKAFTVRLSSYALHLVSWLQYEHICYCKPKSQQTCTKLSL